MEHETQQEPIHLRTPMDLLPGAKAMMEHHGCCVENGSVTLPVGSQRIRCLQILTITQWYEILLPDQSRMLEAYDLQRELSILYVSPEAQSEE